MIFHSCGEEHGVSNSVSHIVLCPSRHIPNTGLIRFGESVRTGHYLNYPTQWRALHTGLSSQLLYQHRKHPAAATGWLRLSALDARKTGDSKCVNGKSRDLCLMLGQCAWENERVVRKGRNGEKYTEEVGPMEVGWSVLRHCFYSDLQACNTEQVLNILPIHQPWRVSNQVNHDHNWAC